MITYRTIKDFQEEQIRELFLSVNWDSGKYPEKIVRGMKNSSVVISAWDGERLIGLVRGLDDGLRYLITTPQWKSNVFSRSLPCSFKQLKQQVNIFQSNLYGQRKCHNKEWCGAKCPVMPYTARV